MVTKPWLARHSRGRQLKRSLNSTALNVAEAFGVHADNARLSFRRALGELYERKLRFRWPRSGATSQTSKQKSSPLTWLLRVGACTGYRGASGPAAGARSPLLALRRSECRLKAQPAAFGAAFVVRRD